MRGNKGWGGAKGLGLSLAALVPIAMAVTGCGESAPTDPEAAVAGSESSAVADGELPLAALLEEVLELDREQLAALEGLASSWAERERHPGDAWWLAAEVEAILDPDQVAKLSPATDARPTRDAPGRRRGGHEGMVGPGPEFAGLGLTDEQRAAIHEILEAREPDLRALHEAIRAGTLDRDAARARIEEIGAEIRAGIEAILTPEQSQAMARRRAESEVRREERRAEAQARGAAVREAMAAALQLTEEQMDQLAAARSEHQIALEQILSEEQLRIVSVHRWLLPALRGGTARTAGPRSGAGQGPRRHGPHGVFFGS